jgi:tight adherence protein B
MNSLSWPLALLASLAMMGAAVSATLWLTPYWDLLAERQMSVLSERFKRLGMNEAGLRYWLRVWGTATLGVFGICWFLLESVPLAIVLTFFSYVAPRHALDFLIRRRTLKLRSQLVGACVGIGNAVRAGLSLPQAIASVAEVTSKPLVYELRRISTRFNRGQPLREAIEDVRNRLDLEPFTLFANAVEISQERGGKLFDVLERIGDNLQEIHRLEQKLESETSAGRQAVFLLSMFPVFFLAGFALLDWQSVQILFSQFSGQCVLSVVMLLVYAGTYWASRIINVAL